MQQTASSLSGSASFAGIMAALSKSVKKTAGEEEDLADDVATLSYEHALRAHARYKAPEPRYQPIAPPDPAFPEPLDPEVLRFCEAIPDEADQNARSSSGHAVSAWTAGPEPNVASRPSTTPDRSLRSASITIRLSNAECEQLRSRAAEAGLTVSAYLRSCTFEAESLRALVKDTLAQMRASQSPANPVAAIVKPPSWRQRLAKFWPHARSAQRVATA